MGFKVGDKVRDNGTGYPSKTDGLVGVVVHGYHYGLDNSFISVLFPDLVSEGDHGVWPFTEDELELVEEAS